MKLNNILLIILICLIGFQKLPLKQKRTVSKATKTISIGKTLETKNIKVFKNEETKDEWKHSTSFTTYLDSDGRSTERLNHNIRIGREYYLSGGIYTRQNSYGQNDIGTTLSITKNW